MLRGTSIPQPPTQDKRWEMVEATMRRNDFQPQSLIETLHSAQQAFGFLDTRAMRWIAASLQVPLSKVYGVATFYHFFTLKPQGEHSCVVCLGTACYIKGSRTLLDEVQRTYHIKEGQTTKDGRLSVRVARCIGACGGAAPVAVVDGRVIIKPSGKQLIETLHARMERNSSV